MQEQPLIDFGNLENVTDLVPGPALDVSEADHEPLHRRELFDRVGHDGASFTLLELIPRLRERRPATGELRVEEARWIDGRVLQFRLGGERRERTAERLLLGTRAGGGDDDPEDPDFQGGAAVETVEPV